jgi:hypothetical protein
MHSSKNDIVCSALPCDDDDDDDEDEDDDDDDVVVVVVVVVVISHYVDACRNYNF